MKSLALPLFIISVILVFVAVMLGPMLFSEIERDHLLKHGVPAAAKIIKLTDTGNRFNENPEVEVELEVTSPAGAVYRTIYTDVISVVDLMNYRPGTLVDVRFDREDSLTVVIVGTSDDRSR